MRALARAAGEENVKKCLLLALMVKVKKHYLAFRSAQAAASAQFPALRASFVKHCAAGFPVYPEALLGSRQVGKICARQGFSCAIAPAEHFLLEQGEAGNQAFGLDAVMGKIAVKPPFPAHASRYHEALNVFPAQVLAAHAFWVNHPHSHINPVLLPADFLRLL